MKTENRQHLQDIYATDHRDKDDYTPQVSSEIRAERQRELRRNQIMTFLLGLVVLGVTVAVTFVIVVKYRSAQMAENTIVELAEKYVPRYDQPQGSESEWVMDYDTSFADASWDGEGDRPFSALWVKKAAYNINMAETALKNSKYDDESLNTAAMYYEQALEIFPDLEGVKIPLGMIYFRVNELEKAIALLETVPEEDLTYDTLNNMGASFLQGKKYEQAAYYLDRSLAKKPGYDKALKNQAALYKAQDMKDEAIAAYEKYLAIRKGDTEARYIYALYLVKRDEWKLAAEQLRQLTEELPDEHMLYRLLARAESRLGNTDASFEALRKASKLSDPQQVLNWMDDQEFDQLRKSDGFQELMKDLTQFRN